MKERPILFSGEMVRAILDGRKTQTRRIIKPQPDAVHGGEPYWNIGGYRAWRHRGIVNPMRMGTHNPLICKYGQPGDRIWVRETWFNDAAFGEPALHYRADGEFCDQFPRYKSGMVGPFRWKPSIHMPRWASRITLEITGVRVERLQDISEEDAEAEGIEVTCEAGPHWRDYLSGHSYREPIDSFCSLWESINGDGSWEVTPWVWVIEFRRACP